MNSLLLAPELFADDGGIARILRLYLKALCELSGDGDQVRFVALNDRAAEVDDLGRYSDRRLVEWRACDRSKAAFIASSARMGLRSGRIVCGHVGQLPVAWLVSRLRPGLPYYLVAHGIEVWRPFSPLERIALRGARRILCVSDYTRARVLENCPLDPARALTLPNALDPSLSPASRPRAAGGPPVILSISRLSIADGYKGIDHLIEAMPAVRASVPAAKLRIVGRGDGTAGLQELARKLGVADAVEFAGYLPDGDLAGEFERCSLFALPSQKEGFGLVYLEAMANGRPCLGARSGGVPEVITAESGVLAEYGDVPGIAAAAVGALRREWSVDAITRRAQTFSYLRFRERLASVFSA